MGDWLDEAEARLMVTNDAQTNTDDVPNLIAEIRRLRNCLYERDFIIAGLKDEISALVLETTTHEVPC